MIQEPSQWIDEMLEVGNFNPDFLHLLNKKVIDNNWEPPRTLRAYKKMEEWWVGKQHVPIDRPSWYETHMKAAYVYAERSHDAQTKHGCVITDKKNRVLAVGYNGVLAGVDDTLLPNIRSEKYSWMLHSEFNSIISCEHKPEGAIVYVTGHPCLSCYLYMCQVGISEIVYDCRPERNSVMIDDEMMALLEVAQFLTQNKTKLTPYEYLGE